MFQFDKVYNSEHNTERFFFVLGTKKECEDFYNTGYTRIADLYIVWSHY